MKRGFLKTAKVKAQGFTSSDLEEPVPLKVPAPLVMKLSYGKVDTARPTEVKALEKPVISEMDGSTVDYSENILAFTTLPLMNLGDTLEDEPDNWTECILAGSIKRQILSTPGFPRPVLKSPGGKVNHRIRASPFGGLGMFAARHLHTGDFIFAERPLLICQRTIPLRGSMSKDITKEQIVQSQMHEWEKYLDVALKRMTDENREAFMRLANSHTEDGSGPILGIIRTNSYQVKGIYDEKLGRDLGAYTGVCKELSRLNHSCSPNVKIHFDMPSLSFELRAVRDIKQGEELFYSYCETLQTRSERSEALAPYGFVCACPGCTGTTEKRDLLRKELSKRVEEIQADHDSWVNDRSLPNMLAPSLYLMSELEQEGLTSTPQFYDLLGITVNIYRLLGDGPIANRYLDKMTQLNRASGLIRFER